MLYQKSERDLGGVAHSRKHGLAREKTVDRHAIDSACQNSGAPRLNAVRVSKAVQRFISGYHFRRDPIAVSRPIGAATNDTGEIAVDGEAEFPGTNGALKPAGDVE